MGLRINHNTSAINTHRNLLASDHALSQTLEKLSSGMKVNRAADGPATLVISEQMRAQIAGLHQAIENSETAVSMIQTTEANLAEVNSLLTSIRQLAIHASNEGVNDTLMLEADQSEINNALLTIDRIAKQAQFGNKKLLDGSNGATGVTTGNDLDFVSAGLKTGDSSINGYQVKVTQQATKAFVDGTVILTDEIAAAGETLTIIEDGRKASYTTNEDDSLSTAVQNLKAEIKKNGLNVQIMQNEDGLIRVEHSEYGSGHSFQVSSTTAGVLSELGGQIQSSESGLDIKGNINNESATGKGQVLTGIAGTEVDGLSVRFSGDLTKTQAENEAAGIGQNEISLSNDLEVWAASRELPGTLVGSVYVAQNSLKFQVGANQGQTVGLSVGSVNTDILSRGIQNKSGFKKLADVNVMDFQGAQDTLSLVDAAIDQITSKRGELGAFQKNSLESNLVNLRIASENMTSSESVLRDTDMASEMAEYTKKQIMTQSATAMLAQANQSPKGVLRLLK